MHNIKQNNEHAENHLPQHQYYNYCYTNITITITILVLQYLPDALVPLQASC